MKTVTGSCLCGAVRFEGTPSARGIGVCHCKMCRVQSSGPFFAARMEGGVRLTETRGLKWFDASDIGERGFCAECGSTMFWRDKSAAESGDWAVSAGALPDDAVGPISEHIWVEDAAPYYSFAGDAPRRTAADCLAGAAPGATAWRSAMRVENIRSPGQRAGASRHGSSPIEAPDRCPGQERLP